MGVTQVFGNCPKCGMDWRSFGVTFNRRKSVSIPNYLDANPHVLGLQCSCGHRVSREQAMSGK